MGKGDKKLRNMIEEKIDEFIKKYGREPGACEVREIQLEIEKEKKKGNSKGDR